MEQTTKLAAACRVLVGTAEKLRQTKQRLEQKAGALEFLGGAPRARRRRRLGEKSVRRFRSAFGRGYLSKRKLIPIKKKIDSYQKKTLIRIKK